MKKNVRLLFIVDGSLNRPILHSQGLPLLREANSKGITCHILSFEEKTTERNKADLELEEELCVKGIEWIKVWSPNLPSVLQRLFVISSGIIKSFLLYRSQKFNVVHARSYRPAMIGRVIHLITGVAYIFDMRGFLIDEQVMLGRWNETSIKYRIGRLMERWCLSNASVIVTNTTKFTERVICLPYIKKRKPNQQIVEIPNTVDTKRFLVDEVKRSSLRKQMHWEKRIVLAFTGEVRKWVSFDSIFAFFKEMKRIDSSVFLALFAYGDLISLENEVKANQIMVEDYCLMTVMPTKIPEYLNASDIGIIIRKENPFIKEVTSPIKFAEYLSSGLPVVVNEGLGDTGRIIKQHRAGVVVNPNEIHDLQEGAAEIIRMVKEDANLREHCHHVAEVELCLDLAIKKYLQIYESLVEQR